MNVPTSNNLTDWQACPEHLVFRSTEGAIILGPERVALTSILPGGLFLMIDGTTYVRSAYTSGNAALCIALADGVTYDHGLDESVWPIYRLD